MTDNHRMDESSVDLVRRGFEAASRGEVDTIAELLAPDVYWGSADRGEYGCHDRQQALRWMRTAIARGRRVELLEARELRDGRVLVLLQRSAGAEGEAPPPPHGQIVGLRDGRIAEMLVYPTAEEATAAAGLA
jgi:hypothetical protein